MELNFLKDLNEEQQRAVAYIDGPSLVVAGAGSGKTRVLTYKIAYLLKNGYRPSSILALTFTNKAAREMKERIAKIVGFDTARYLWMGTFHSIFSKILKAENQNIGYTKNFTVYDSSDSKSLLKAIVKELKLDDKLYKPGLVQSRISMAKNNLITPDAYSNINELVNSDAMNRVPLIKDIYKIYSNRCKQADAMDFDDMLMLTNNLFRDNPSILEKYQSLFSFILVDEYQDTNIAQYMIIKRLAEAHQRICVVGDDAQSIYSFRGANIQNILKFRENYPSAQIFKLEQNYRSTQTIVNAANSLIRKNARQIDKTIYSENSIGSPIKVVNVFTDYEEGFFVSSQIIELKGVFSYKYQDFSVLYRTNAQSRVLEDAMRKQHIPYRIYGGVSFYQRKEIKDVIAYFRFVCNTSDEEALKRIINYPARGIGETTMGKIFDCARLHNITAWEVMINKLKYNLPVNNGISNKLTVFTDMIRVFNEQVDTVNAYELANLIVKTTGIFTEFYTDRSTEALSRKENIDELLKALYEFVEKRKKSEESIGYLSDFLDEVSLLTDQDTENDEKSDKITLMTVHAAKGLEFKTVFIVGMEEELFPSSYSSFNTDDLEEERRLFYVALTRAEEHCFVTYAKTRFRNGQNNFCNPSRFIKDIDPAFLELPQEQKIINPEINNFYENKGRNIFLHKNNLSQNISEKPLQFYKPRNYKKIDTYEKQNVIQTSNEDIPTGAFVRHAIFGIGKVLKTSISNGNEKVEIDFGEKGTKSLLLKFAKLEILK